MIAILDYGSGNTFSVYNALDYIGADVVVSRDPAEIRRADRLILPGVGAFGKCMERIRDYHIDAILHEEVIVRQKPFLGICVGMQVLASVGLEKGEFPGLGWIEGSVRLMETGDSKLKLPHVGWNDVEYPSGCPLFKRIHHDKDRAFYFVHSYHLVPDDPAWTLATAEYGISFTAAVLKGNIAATQFHPEKSQKNGLQFLENFMDWEGGSC